MFSRSYANMDFIFLSAVAFCFMNAIVVSYDIACQWIKHLRERITKFPLHMQRAQPSDVEVVIPKLHYNSHTQKEHSQYSTNFVLGCARTDGEGIERRWWFVQPIAASTIGMGPGRRQSVLEDHWGYSNWRKYVMMREFITVRLLFNYLSTFWPHAAYTLKRRLLLAIDKHAEHHAHFKELTASIADRDLVSEWTAQVEAWERDHSLPDPYYVVTEGVYHVLPTKAPEVSLEMQGPLRRKFGGR